MSPGGRPDPGVPAIVADGLSKRFGERVAFEELSLEIARGEVFGFLGPNGAGKTTTVRTLATLLEPSSGRASVLGFPLTQEHGMQIRQRVAVMPESPGLYLRLSVRENLEFFADLYGVDATGRRIGAALEAVGMTERGRDPCGALSKGLRQRVALARVLLSDPELVFLDEPTAGLDPVAAHDVRGLIAGLREREVTVFLTTHRLEEAEQVCDRVAILATRLRTVGRPQDLRQALFGNQLVVQTMAPLADPSRVFTGLVGVQSWRAQGAARYVLTVTDPAVAAPATTRALVGAGADVLSIGTAHQSLSDVYFSLIANPPGAGAP